MNNINSTTINTVVFDNEIKQNDIIPFTFTKFLIATACVIVICLSVFGNALTISVISRYKKLKNATNYILLSLAIADLTVSVCVMLPAMIQDVLQKWIFSKLFCLFYNGFDITCCTASILHLLLISIDRYMAIFNPLRYRNTVRTWHIFSLVGFLWFISFGMSFIPIFMGWNKLPRKETSSTTLEGIESNYTTYSFEYNANIDLDNNAHDEKCMLEANVTYSIISSSLSFFIPLIVMTIVYIQIYIVARRQSKAIERTIGGRRHFSNDTTNSYLLNQTTTDNYSSVNEQSFYKYTTSNNDDKKGRFTKLIKQLKIIEKKKSKDTKAIKTLGIIMGIFIVCWLPFFIMYLYVPLSGGHPPPLIVDRLITWIGYINSFINPIIYALTNRDFRKAYISTLREISKKIFPKSFYYSTFGRNDIDSIYYNPNRTSTDEKKNKNQNDNQMNLCKFINLIKCCKCCKAKENISKMNNHDENHNNNCQTELKKNDSLKTVNINSNNCTEAKKFIEIVNNKSDEFKNQDNKILISNFQALSEDQNSLLYIDNDRNSNDNDSLDQDLVIYKTSFSNQDGSDDVFEQETSPQIVSFLKKGEKIDQRTLKSNHTSYSNNPSINMPPKGHHENIFSKFRKSFIRNHNNHVNQINQKIDLNYELDILKHDLEDVKDKMLIDTDSYLTSNTLTDATSSKKDSLINPNNVNLSEKLKINHYIQNNGILVKKNKTTASQRIKNIFSFNYTNNKSNINNSSNHDKKNSFIFYNSKDKSPISLSKLIDENVTVFRV